MPKSARFCPKCGTTTLTYRRAVQSEFYEQGADARRAAWALAILFLGTTAALLLPGEEALFVNWYQDLATIAVCFFALFILGRGHIRTSFAQLCSATQLGLSVGVGLVAFAISRAYVSGLELLGATQGTIELAGLSLLSVVLVTPLIEEWTYRGVAWKAAQAIGGERFTLILTAAIFALAHGLNGGLVLEFPHRFIDGLLFGWLRLKSDSLLPGIVAHALLNGLAVNF